MKTNYKESRRLPIQSAARRGFSARLHACKPLTAGRKIEACLSDVHVAVSAPVSRIALLAGYLNDARALSWFYPAWKPSGTKKELLSGLFVSYAKLSRFVLWKTFSLRNINGVWLKKLFIFYKTISKSQLALISTHKNAACACLFIGANLTKFSSGFIYSSENSVRCSIWIFSLLFFYFASTRKPGMILNISICQPNATRY